jgi:hypothetical protein
MRARFSVPRARRPYSSVTSPGFSSPRTSRARTSRARTSRARTSCARTSRSRISRPRIPHPRIPHTRVARIPRRPRANPHRAHSNRAFLPRPERAPSGIGLRCSRSPRRGHSCCQEPDARHGGAGAAMPQPGWARLCADSPCPRWQSGAHNCRCRQGHTGWRALSGAKLAPSRCRG